MFPQKKDIGGCFAIAIALRDDIQKVTFTVTFALSSPFFG